MTEPTTVSPRRALAARAALASAGVVLGLSLLAWVLVGTLPAFAAQRSHRARMARTLNTTDTAHLHYVRSSGSELFEEGSASGTLPGNMRATLDIGPTVTTNFTIYTRDGTIKGRGTGTPHGSGIYESFAGSLVATGGTGRYTHARGRAGLYGTFNRKTYGVVVQTTGRLSY